MINEELHRGDIIIAETNDARRYGIIVTNNAINGTTNQVGVVSISTVEERRGPGFVEIFTNVCGVAVCERIWNIWKSDVAEVLRECTAEEMDSIDKALRYCFGLVEVGAYTACKPEIEALNVENQALTDKTHEQAEMIRNLSRELEDARKDTEFFMQKAVGEKNEAADIVTVTAQRDTYKAMYEALIDRMFKR